MLWQALRALIFGYIISAGIQVLITREQMAQVLGERGAKSAGLASFFGFISSSCSFAALAASRSVLTKGAHPANALAFLIASTNLVIELGIVLWLLLGWKFTLGNLLLGSFMIVYAYALTKLYFPMGLAEDAKRHADRQQQGEGMEMAMSGDVEKNWKEKLLSLGGWRRIASAFFMEWKMVYKEILLGFTVAGFISVFVPQSFWNSLFLVSTRWRRRTGGFWLCSKTRWLRQWSPSSRFIGSMGNVPLAAMLWSKNASFGGVMSFLGADLVAATVVYIHAKYYGWKYAGYLSLLLYVCMVAAGLTTHYLYALTGMLPIERPSLGEMVRFEIDYTFWLNIVFALIAGTLFYLHWRGTQQKGEARQKRREQPARA